MRSHTYFELEYSTKARDPGVILPLPCPQIPIKCCSFDLKYFSRYISFCPLLLPLLFRFFPTYPSLTGHLPSISNPVAAILTQVLLIKAKYDYINHRLPHVCIFERLRNVMISKLMSQRPLISRREGIWVKVNDAISMMTEEISYKASRTRADSTAEIRTAAVFKGEVRHGLTLDN